MPSSVASVLLGLGLILALAGAPVAAVIVGAVACCIEIGLFIYAGLD